MLQCRAHYAIRGKILTEFRESRLVAFAGKNRLLLGFGFLGDLLDGSEPAVPLSTVGSIKLVLVSTQLEGELVGTRLLDVFSIGLLCSR